MSTQASIPSCAESPESLFDRALATVDLGQRGNLTLDQYATNPADDEATRAHYREAVAAARAGDYDECRAALLEAARTVAAEGESADA